MTHLACGLCTTEFTSIMPQVAKQSLRRHRMVCIRASSEARVYFRQHRLWPRPKSAVRPLSPPPRHRMGRPGPRVPVFRG